MFECKICGLLSLGGSACPACGSLLLVDLTEEDGDTTMLPSEVPGLDEAVASWYELEGIEAPDESEDETPNSPGESLPFGFSGESNTHISRLPFGVGSYAGGMPFDETEDALPLISEHSLPIESRGSQVALEPAEVVQTAPDVKLQSIPAQLTIEPPVVEEAPVMVTLPEVVVEPQPVPTIVEPEPMRVSAVEVVPITAVVEREETNSSFEEAPEMWRIDASPVDMNQIYAMEDQVVEVVHDTEQHHEQYIHTTSSDDLHPDSGVISLDLHPAKAMGVQLDGLPELEDTLAEGFYAIGQESWAQAAIAFQKMAAKMPGDSAVFNNYGLALLQRALVMAKSSDLEMQQLASTQFESSILALREAAKTAPTNPTILLNLSHALLVSGRAEKALTLLNMFEKSHSKTSESGNLEAASLVSLGESGQALRVLNLVPQDETIRSNLSKLTY